MLRLCCQHVWAHCYEVEVWQHLDDVANIIFCDITEMVRSYLFELLS